MKRYLKVLAVLVLGLVVVAGIGSAGVLTATEDLDLHMVEGAFPNVNDEISEVTYAIGESGTITGTYVVAGSYYKDVVVSLDHWGSDTNNIECTPADGSFECVYALGSGYSSTQTIDIIAVGDQD